MALANGMLRIGFLGRDRAEHPGARAEAEFTGVLMHDIGLHFFTDAAVERPTVEFPFSAPEDPQPYRRTFPGGVRCPSRRRAGVRRVELVFPRFSTLERRAYAERVSSSAYARD